MVTCPHQQPSEIDRFSTCKLVGDRIIILTDHGCRQQCQPEWKNGKPPKRKSETPFLRNLTGSAPPAPGKLARGVAFARALVKWARAGFPFTGRKSYGDRLRICRNCEHQTAIWTCGRCGCFIPLKASFASESCPDNPARWTATSSGVGCGCGRGPKN